MSEIPLKPCPFCSGTADIVELGMGNPFITYRVMCMDCSVRTLAFKDKKDCVLAWNRRVTDE